MGVRPRCSWVAPGAGRPRGLGLVVGARVRALGAGARPWHNGLGVSGWRSYWTCCGR